MQIYRIAHDGHEIVFSLGGAFPITFILYNLSSSLFCNPTENIFSVYESRRKYLLMAHGLRSWMLVVSAVVVRGAILLYIVV